MKLVNPFKADGHWFKANLHCHTTGSDGDSSVAERVEQYRGGGYDVLAITDHHTTNDVAGLSDEKFLVISGMEDHPKCYFDGDLYHFVCLNVPHGFSLAHLTDANEHIAAVRAAGGEVILAHPYWCGHNVNHVMAVSGYIALEVYNTCCAPIGKAYSSVVWDDVLDAGRVLPAVAVDDTHSSGRNLFKGWTMIKASELTVDAIMDALRCGRYYATNGPEINKFDIVDGKIDFACSPAKEIHFMSQRCIGHSVYAEDGELLTEANVDLRPEARYVRAEIVDVNGLRAWSNPIMIDREDA